MFFFMRSRRDENCSRNSLFGEAVGVLSCSYYERFPFAAGISWQFLPRARRCRALTSSAGIERVRRFSLGFYTRGRATNRTFENVFVYCSVTSIRQDFSISVTVLKSRKSRPRVRRIWAVLYGCLVQRIMSCTPASSRRSLARIVGSSLCN